MDSKVPSFKNLVDGTVPKLCSSPIRVAVLCTALLLLCRAQLAKHPKCLNQIKSIGLYMYMYIIYNIAQTYKMEPGNGSGLDFVDNFTQPIFSS